jgi:hypothetical protein
MASRTSSAHSFANYDLKARPLIEKARPRFTEQRLGATFASFDRVRSCEKAKCLVRGRHRLGSGFLAGVFGRRSANTFVTGKILNRGESMPQIAAAPASTGNQRGYLRSDNVDNCLHLRCDETFI